MESLGDDELALVINWFSRFHNNCMNRWHDGGPKESLKLSRMMPLQVLWSAMGGSKGIPRYF
jgi:hypothetical protein